MIENFMVYVSKIEDNGLSLKLEKYTKYDDGSIEICENKYIPTQYRFKNLSIIDRYKLEDIVFNECKRVWFRDYPIEEIKFYQDNKDTDVLVFLYNEAATSSLQRRVCSASKIDKNLIINYFKEI